MSAATVQLDSSRAPDAEANANANATPMLGDIASFRAALQKLDGGGEAFVGVDAASMAALDPHELLHRTEPFFDHPQDGDDPASGTPDRQAFAETVLDDEMSPGGTRAARAAWHAHARSLNPPAVSAMPAVARKRRIEFGTHLARAKAMQPVSDLLVLVRSRAPGQAVPDLRIVPPEPNPLKLTLHLAMNDEEFVVKAHTALGADRREEVQQALHVLEVSLAARLRMPARVVLLA